ncbi:hypothetical protein RclHR1_06060005 [Rhizophagus clarus]|uniref:Uncharacterized protein n=1 Tax=Rhizophagus clarus TaxID=94130 RepID=A0A2Z6SHC5_9GLOM|nr:hypothetical protein RclHR1_06060005 [Rhizophagus clarus]GES88929.1 hypothetical protein RCL_e22373_RclHR1_06060005 [Rhizophagus clarus]
MLRHMKFVDNPPNNLATLCVEQPSDSCRPSPTQTNTLPNVNSSHSLFSYKYVEYRRFACKSWVITASIQPVKKTPSCPTKRLPFVLNYEAVLGGPHATKRSVYTL